MIRYKKIVLAGGSGQMGTAICKYFSDKAEKIIVLSRGAEGSNGNIHFIRWDGENPGPWVKEMEDCEIVINLAGKNVNCRYNEKNKKIIFDSRTNSIHALTEAFKTSRNKPRLWIQCASATIYRHAEDRPMTEDFGEIGYGFSVEVCKKWEKTFYEKTESFRDMQKAVLRTSLVLGKTEGVFPRLKNLTLFGLGGKQGNGKQWVSWIHETDVARIVEWIATHPEINGPVNCTAPVPLKNKEYMSVIRKAFKMPIALPSPTWLLEFGALLIGTETELILKSRWVLPEKLLRSGFQFQYPEVKEAIEDLVRT